MTLFVISTDHAAEQPTLSLRHLSRAVAGGNGVWKQ
jgi:hypothetical protein